NGGETIRLVDSAGATLHQFTYTDEAPWPKAADGYGASVTLRSLASPSLDHTLPGSWTPSAQFGGLPGGTVTPLDFAGWRTLHFSPSDAADTTISGPDADHNNNGISNFVEFALGTLPDDPGSALALLPAAYIEAGGDQTYLAIDIRVASAAGLTVLAEVTQDLSDWTGDPDVTLVSGPDVNPDGSTTYKFRSTKSLENTSGQHIRTRFTQ
ncbi:MAG: hypothetical protein P8J87_04030, partial [Verrucomicrobiales bacterium]|nr:hypothetical protein [Verrucomicrobiales bacterium]